MKLDFVPISGGEPGLARPMLQAVLDRNFFLWAITMTSFLDGPAKGQTLMLKRCARFLRVTDANGKWDALDAWEDSPRPEEKLYCYALHGKPGGAFIDGTGIRGFYAIAEYQFVEPQPDESTMRDDTKWHLWRTEKEKT